MGENATRLQRHLGKTKDHQRITLRTKGSAVSGLGQKMEGKRGEATLPDKSGVGANRELVRGKRKY